jgi:hypothetical protein
MEVLKLNWHEDLNVLPQDIIRDFDGVFIYVYSPTIYHKIQHHLSASRGTCQHRYTEIKMKVPWDQLITSAAKLPQLIDIALKNRPCNFFRFFADHACTVPSFVKQLLNQAAEFGQLEVLKYMYDIQNEHCSHPSLERTAMRGFLDVVQLLNETQRLDRVQSECVMDLAAVHGHLDVVEYLFSQGYNCRTRAMTDAASNGHFEVVKFLHENTKAGCTFWGMNGAAANGHLDVVEFLHEHRDEGCTSFAMDGAAAGGHLEVVQYLHEHRTEGCSTNALDCAARNGYLEVVEFLYENRWEGGTEMAAVFAAGQGHLDVVVYLYENDVVDFPQMVMDIAAHYGHVVVVEYLIECTSLEWSYKSALEHAARRQRHDVLKYLHFKMEELWASGLDVSW